MEHIMKLNPEPFNKIKEGSKTIELRLYDEKRQVVKTGDIICFVNNEDIKEKLKVIVENIYVFDSFEELYKSLPLNECGYDDREIEKAKAGDMDKFYSKEKQKKYGAAGIKVRFLG